ncbi:RsiV family protein [Pseudomonas cremoricolorata]|uniref:Lipoprotein n=1 Tax=Pseudomonas cremoricolorata TaxID=157783 RepID=A0A089WG96_9PSED|nr:RsiV family protein [Pseudomonas cremoricolorata]AIR88330.1 lipoprotein [Pseudomonas cremoricolorata]
MTLVKLTSVAVLALALGACQSVFAPNYRTPLEVKRDAWEHIKPGCTESDCPLVNIDTVSFPALPKLDGIVERRLLQLTEDNERSTPPSSLKAYEQQYLATAQKRNSSYLQAKVREQHDGLVIVELSSYLDTGGAHGMPGRDLINYSRQQDKVLTLQDMLLPGQEDTFWKTVAESHRAWLMSVEMDKDAEFIKTWPFRKSPHIALTYGAMIVKYEVYAIAPYSMGHVELKIPYPRLNGILKPELFPGRG